MKGKKTFLDKDIKEPAFQSKEPEQLNLYQIRLAPMFPFGIFSILLWIAAIAMQEIGCFYFSLFPFAFYVFIAISVYKKRRELSSDDQKEYEKSKKRLSNKEYIIQLIELGYNVPTNFLEKNYPDLLHYKHNK